MPIFPSGTVIVDGKRFTVKGEFKTKKEAKQAAAKKAYQSLTTKVHIPPPSPHIPPKVQEVEEEEVEEFLVLSNFTRVCVVIDLDNIKISPTDLKRLTDKKCEVHLFFSASKNMNLLDGNQQVQYHRAPKLIPEMTDHCISWWVCENCGRLSSQGSKLIIHSKDAGIGSVAELAQGRGVQTEFKNVDF